METIKNHTDLNQSRELAKILPFESADMCYYEYTSHIDGTPKVGYKEGITDGIPCWSLAALLNVLSLPDLIQDKVDGELFWQCSVYDEDGNSLCETYDNNPVDACVTMIERLHELNLL